MNAPNTSGPNGQDMLMSPMDVAKYLGIGRTMVYELIGRETNRIKSYKINKRRVLRRSDVDRWLEAQVYDPANECEEHQ